ncbi:hypothetical protein K488DRAFT_86471 [Vararia minispora EC-137]|uniref:Uncharacterized protein n=1 Tax=Vararia minispora EC-137 TaxID=1314806 RepID=A0ACB8QJG4_9AGAM|nr:hypothetical protein K488DRAFT_86471 [Vararia minispora EC-137]
MPVLRGFFGRRGFWVHDAGNVNNRAFLRNKTTSRKNDQQQYLRQFYYPVGLGTIDFICRLCVDCICDRHIFVGNGNNNGPIFYAGVITVIRRRCFPIFCFIWISHIISIFGLYEF